MMTDIRFLLLLSIIIFNVPKSFAQHDPSFETFKNYFDFEELIQGSWETVQRETEGYAENQIDSIQYYKSKIGVISFFPNICLYSNFAVQESVQNPSLKFRGYEIVKDSAANNWRLNFLDKETDSICRQFIIVDFSFNRLVLSEFDFGNKYAPIFKNVIRTYKRSDEINDESAGIWLHFGNFGIYNLSDTDTLEHHFTRILRGQDTRDTLTEGDLTFQLEFLTNYNYFSFCNAGVLGSVNIGKYKIDLLNQRIYFFDSDYLVYDYYFVSDMELVLKLNPELSALKD